jgi:hypothetical protein
VRGGHPAYQPFVDIAAGLECHPMRPDGGGPETDRAIVSRIMDPLRGPVYIVRHVMMPHLRDMYDDLFEGVQERRLSSCRSLRGPFAAPSACDEKARAAVGPRR